MIKEFIVTQIKESGVYINKKVYIRGDSVMVDEKIGKAHKYLMSKTDWTAQLESERQAQLESQNRRTNPDLALSEKDDIIAKMQAELDAANAKIEAGISGKGEPDAEEAGIVVDIEKLDYNQLKAAALKINPETSKKLNADQYKKIIEDAK